MTDGGRTVAVRDLPGIIEKGQCMGCGFCSISLQAATASCATAGGAQVDYRWIEVVEHWGPVLHAGVAERLGNERRVCPGAVMDMPALADDVFGRQPHDPMLGEALRIAVGHATSPEIRRQAASGGITTALLARGLEAGSIDVAYCAAGRSPKTGGGVLARGRDDLLKVTGSHYHPLAFGRALGELVGGRERFAFVGLPCEVAAMRELMRFRPDVAERCVLIIGLFCGGINRFSGIGRYLERFDIDPAAVSEIDYREGVWPGQISARLAGQAEPRRVPRIRGNTRWGILHYMISFQGYWMLPRCRICPDQIADFADIAVGDPHLPRFKARDDNGFSAVVARTQVGLAILDDAERAGTVALAPFSRDELVKSQGYTLENRRRTLVYSKMARRFGIEPPEIEVYAGLEPAISPHQHIYAFVDLAKIRYRHAKWLRPLYLPLQIFEYLFLTFSPRLILSRLVKLTSNR